MATECNNNRPMATLYPLLLLWVCLVNGVYCVCPPTCQCEIYGGYRRVQCDPILHPDQLTRPPDDPLPNIPPDTEVLTIEGYENITLTGKSFHHLPNITTLHLKHNPGLQIQGDPFKFLPYLQNLSLAHCGLGDSDMANVTLPELVILDMVGNDLTHIPSAVLTPENQLNWLHLGRNNISSLPSEIMDQLSELVYLNLSHNQLVQYDQDENETSSVNLIVLDLSHNAIQMISGDSFRRFNHLTHLYLHHNELLTLNPAWFEHLSNLTLLTLAYNPLTSLPARAWASCLNLQILNISHLDLLNIVDTDAFQGLEKLELLDMSYNPQLAYIHALTFQPLTNLNHLDLRHNALITLDIATFANMSQLEMVRMAGNAWNCNCDLHWLGPSLSNISTDKNIQESNSIFHADDFVCVTPIVLEGLHLIEILPTHNFSCHGARIVNFTEIASHAIGSAAVINCVAVGDPLPHITWITPRKKVIRYLPTFVHPGRPGPQYAEYHENHQWHNSMEYMETLSTDNRIHVLSNGSLYIDYVLRSDAGPYTCLVHNQYGNDTIKIHFRLDYYILSKTMVRSMIIGFIAAAGFFVLGLITGLIRYLAFKCSREQRQKRKSIREILEGLETYRSDKMDKFSAYKTAKIDQLSAFKTAKVDKLRGYKNITVQSLVQYLHRSREHYTNQTFKIRDNCAQQVEKVRESYSLQKLKFKDYRSHQVEKIKDNYNGQLLKIRQYGSGQMERLRDQYKLQQQHILKLLELLDIGNCMTVIEAECLRTESMIFNPDLTFDLETAVYMPRDDSQSDYMTAGDTTDNSSEHSHTGTINFEVKLDNEIIPFSELRSHKSKSQSTSTLTQQKVDQTEKKVTSSRKTENTQTSGSNSKTSVSTKDSNQKSRTSRRKHRHKPHRRDSNEDDEEEHAIEKRPQKRRGTSRERKEKREQKKETLKSASRGKSENLQRREKVVRSPEEINRTLREIAVDLDKLKREPLTLSLPDLNLDLSHGVFTDESTPPQSNSPSHECEYVCHSPPPELLSEAISAHVGPSGKSSASLRREFQQHSNQCSTDVASTDYESAQEPESREATPVAGCYEHTGSPHSFASFPSTPSTPTLPGDNHHVIILKPDSSPNHQARESTV